MRVFGDRDSGGERKLIRLRTRARRVFRAIGILSTGGMVAAATLAGSGFVLSGLAASSTVVLSNNVLQGLSTLSPIGDTARSAVIGIGVGLQGANPAGLDAYIAGAYDPTSSLY